MSSSSLASKKHVDELKAASTSKRKEPSSGNNTQPPSAGKRKKRKRDSPFRIKAGCIVALRYRPGGNHVKIVTSDPDGTDHEMPPMDSDSSFAEVWTDPLPGRDEGLALIGRRVRCCFPKSAVGDHQRVVEGEVISIVDYEKNFDSRRQMRRQRAPCPTAVELLIDKDALSRMPFLERVDDDVEDISILGSSERKRRQLEDTIRGKNKVSVHVTLADASRIRTSKQGNDVRALTAKWVIRKRVAIAGKKPKNAPATDSGSNGVDADDANGNKQGTSHKAGSESMTRYLGDGKDPDSQQERNFRWLACRMDDMALQDESTEDPLRRILNSSVGLVGEVLRVKPSTSPGSGSLAQVTLRRLVLPEHTKTCRISHHGPTDVFDDADSHVEATSGENGQSVNFVERLIQVPVEEVIIIHRHFERDFGLTVNEGRDASRPVVSQEYSLAQDSYRPLRLSSETGDNAKKAVDSVHTNGQKGPRNVCHRCRRTAVMVSKKRVLNRMAAGKTVQWGYFCQGCHDALKSLGKDKSGARFALPCDCRACCVGSEAVVELSVADSIVLGNAMVAGDHAHANGISNGGTRDRDSSICAICGNISKSGMCCSRCEVGLHKHCSLWDLSLTEDHVEKHSDKQLLCRACRTGAVRSHSGNGKVPSPVISPVLSVLAVMRPVDFELPAGFMNVSKLPLASLKPMTKTRKTKRKAAAAVDGGQKKKKMQIHIPTPATKESANENEEQLKDEVIVTPAEEENDVFVPTCSRSIPYNPMSKRISGAPKASEDAVTPSTAVSRGAESAAASKSRPSRQRSRDPGTAEKKTSRSARATQRRMMKDVAAIGASGFELDLLAGREQQLRFDRSGIHAWGVFADVDINAGDMVVEYRGELIGNALAEKREREYESAKIGSDYMFRIDAYAVCDATKQGNVARFINASCDPNCYTQIVTINGVKRIVIYAKKDIAIGQELCYDYKFPFEFDEAKRIECHCGASNCRGYMNWDKRYIALPPAQSPEKPGESLSADVG